MFDVTYRLTLEDYKAYLEAYRLRSRFPWIGTAVFWIAFSANIAIASYFVIHATRGEGQLILAIPYFGLALLLLAVVNVLAPWFHKRNFQRLRLGQSDIRLQATDRKLTIRQAGLDADAQWQVIECITETPSHIFLWLSRAQAFILPLRAFAAQTEAARFLDFVRARIHAASGE
jgi:YcxB-like protein